MPSPTAADLVDHIALDSSGRAFLVNALASVDLVAPGFVADFVEDLRGLCDAGQPSSWRTQLSALCIGSCTPGPRRPDGYLRAAARDALAHEDGGQLTTVCSATTAIAHQVDRRRIESGDGPLPSFPPRDAADVRCWLDCLLVEDCTGWLGKPPAQGGNCWISCTGLDDAVPPEDVPHAGVLCERLGVWPLPSSYYVEYSFPAAALGAIENNVLVRPTFADLGSGWFRVEADHPQGRRYAEAGWGATLDIRAVRLAQADDVGRPERVSTAIPMRRLVERNQLRLTLHAPMPLDYPAVPAADRPGEVELLREVEARLAWHCRPEDLVKTVLEQTGR